MAGGWQFPAEPARTARKSPLASRLVRVKIVVVMAAHTHLDGTIQLPNGRTIPVVISVDLAQVDQELERSAVEQSAIEATDPLLLRAAEVFGNEDKALSWLNSTNYELGGRTPRELASTAEGRDQVLGILVGLEQGFPA